ncbi:MAG TPA: serine/threonine-protein kinase, partial [Vicinamibacterales bacterium]|nr:serine/threonine-protein kinase [Vicinamibacterales bacterium]
MSLSPGSRLGRYEILNPLGAGGMGEVYRARDTRLDRDVAIKILPESVARDPERLARFDREAKAVAALSHPNILALHDAGTEDGTTFAVMELLDGETLRDRLASGPLPVRRAVDTAVQIARGLAAAHAKGLVHRDLKPENVFLVADGQVKILDFGLAKAADPGDSTATTTHAPAMTDPGTVLGTVGYMAPEQVRGHAVDARTDLFALGSVFYEMLTGQRAFRRDTAAETMTAILREDPPDLPQPQSAQAPALDRIIRHCLEKNPGERFQSARDVAFALEALSGTTGSSGTSGAPGASRAEVPPTSVRSSRAGLAGAALVLAVAVAAAAWAAGYVHFGAATPAGTSVENITYQPVTFDEGFVFAARFARDGRTIVYSADWENQKTRDIFVTSLDNTGSRALGYKGSDLLAVSPDGALAILMDGTVPGGNPYGRRGTIARASLTGGAPRPELDRVTFADFGPDQSLAVIRDVRQKRASETVEWPQGTPLKEPETSADFVSSFPTPRVSPSGAHIAFFVCRGTGCSVRIAA